MNERAAKSSDARSELLLPIWHVERGRALFVGPLTYNAPHAHSVPVFLAGIYDSFGLRVGPKVRTGGREGSAWTRCRTAVIPAGLPYELNVGGSPIAVLYLEPSEGGVEALEPLVELSCEAGGAVIGQGGSHGELRDIYEARAGAAWAGPALDSLLIFSKQRATRSLDARVLRVVSHLLGNPEASSPAADVSREVGLSSSRFQHLFAREVGVPFRRYRIWQRLRGAIDEIVGGSNFTTAAYAAGFSDQAHFAREFRRTFGAPASPSLRKVRR